MEFKKRRREDVGDRGYPTRLQLYKNPPVETIDLHEFEELALTRLKLLQEVDKIRQQCSHEGVHKDDARRRMECAHKIMPLQPVDDSGLREDHVSERRRDHISHYILRLAYCRTEEMRRWLLSQETELLRWRFLHLITHQDREKFFQIYKSDFDFELVVLPHPDDADETSYQLACEVFNFFKEVKFYKVPFTKALDLVQSRRVVVKEGFAYVPHNSDDMIVSLVCNKFRAQLSAELVKTLHHLAVVDEDERIAPLLRSLKSRYLGEDFTNAGTQFAGKISLSQLDSLSKESFAPCMRHLHETLRKEHHLKHFGRLQYGLFLKSIGLTLDQALKFWRSEFIKKMEPEKFDKQYSYNVRHAYGKEGKRANYTAYSCMKIILSNSPGQGDHHGCPFRHWDGEHLCRMLSAHGVSQKGTTEIMDYVRNSHYQLACQKYFEITHAMKTVPFGLEHPTQYFLESRKVRGGLVEVKGEEGEEVGREQNQAVESSTAEFADLSAEDLEGLMDMN